MHFSQSLWQQNAGHSFVSIGGASSTWSRLPQGWKQSCYGLIQIALEQGKFLNTCSMLMTS